MPHPPLHHRDDGAGPPLLWGHGLTHSMALDDQIALLDWPQLAQHTRLLRYDARGHGRSPASLSPEAYRWPQLAQDQLALADCLGLDRYTAGGFSMGCATALHAACLQPDRIQALVLVCPPTAWERRPAQAALYQRMALALERRGPVALDAVLRSRALGPAWRLASQPELKLLHDQAWRDLPIDRLAAMLRGADSDLPEAAALRQLQQPTLILAWPDDPHHPLETAEQLAALLPQAQLKVARSTHDVDQWTRLMVEFLNR